jgi:hypothetical protein
MTSPAGLGRPRRWLAGLAWGLWALAMLGLAVVPWVDRLTIRAGRPDLATKGSWGSPMFWAFRRPLASSSLNSRRSFSGLIVLTRARGASPTRQR